MVHACSVCQKSFPSDKLLHGHRINSKLETCRECLYCDYIFLNKFKKQIRNHMKSKHSDVSCEMCNRKFFLTGGLDDHIRDVHGYFYLTSSGSRRRDEQATRRGTETVYNRVTSVQHHQSRTMAPRQPQRNGSFLSDIRTYNGDLFALLHGKVKPDQTKLEQCRGIIEHLMLFMQHNTKYNVAEVVKGGSLSKGTSIRAKVDIDVVVFLNDFRNVQDMRDKMKTVLRDLKEHITQDANWAAQVEFTRSTSHSIQFKLKTDPAHELSEIDLLPACDLGNGPRSMIFREMVRLNLIERGFYSACLVKDQVDFVKKVPDSVKDLIQLVKHWKRTEDIGIVSYCIELIVISQWRSWGQPLQLDLKTSFRKILEFISHFSTARITWPTQYRQLDYMRLPSPPYVMDPANPFIDTAARVMDVDSIEEKARDLLRHL